MFTLLTSSEYDVRYLNPDYARRVLTASSRPSRHLPKLTKSDTMTTIEAHPVVDADDNVSINRHMPLHKLIINRSTQIQTLLSGQ